MTLAALAIVAIVMTALLVWVIRTPGPDTEYGRENRARRAAKRAARSRKTHSL